jgi:SAM-dependent methyltransferase
MDVARAILMRTFGRPEGLLGRLGGTVMARMNRPAAAWGVEFARTLREREGPGDRVRAGHRHRTPGQMGAGHRVAGIDPSREMVGQAARRNAAAIARNVVDLRRGTADDLPFDDDTFDAALANNSMQVWPYPVAGLREIRRVAKAGGRLALVFTPRSGRAQAGITQLLSDAGFVEEHLVEGDPGFAAVACTPRTAS